LEALLFSDQDDKTLPIVENGASLIQFMKSVADDLKGSIIIVGSPKIGKSGNAYLVVVFEKSEKAYWAKLISDGPTFNDSSNMVLIVPDMPLSL
jgi:hypothetical protein